MARHYCCKQLIASNLRLLRTAVPSFCTLPDARHPSPIIAVWLRDLPAVEPACGQVVRTPDEVAKAAAVALIEELGSLEILDKRQPGLALRQRHGRLVVRPRIGDIDVAREILGQGVAAFDVARDLL